MPDRYTVPPAPWQKQSFFRRCGLCNAIHDVRDACTDPRRHVRQLCDFFHQVADRLVPRQLVGYPVGVRPAKYVPGKGWELMEAKPVERFVPIARGRFWHA